MINTFVVLQGAKGVYRGVGLMYLLFVVCSRQNLKCSDITLSTSPQKCVRRPSLVEKVREIHKIDT